MLDLKFIRENTSVVRQAIIDKNSSLDLDQLLTADKDLLELKKEMQSLQEQRNANAKNIPKASAEERPKMIEHGKEIGNKLEAIKPLVDEAEKKLQNFMYYVPNIPANDVPRGKSELENVEIRRHGQLPQFKFKPLDHVEILNKHGWAEFERIPKVAGSRSYSLCNEGVILEMSVLRLAMDILRQKKMKLITFPSLAREFCFYGTGHFPANRAEAYHLANDDLYLTGTSEVSMTGLHSGEMLKEEDLPIMYGGLSSCFRREAGSGGKDTRGLIRVHQFQKVEQFIICKNSVEESDRWHKILLETSEEILHALEIPYRVIEVCTGDMGDGKYRMHDVESWVPSENKYRETHSCSTLHEWQARRGDLRYRGTDGKVYYCHTLNNTAIASPRILVPFLENHQLEDGRIRVPKALQAYIHQEFLGS